MLKHLKVQTVYALIDLVDAVKQIHAMRPRSEVVSLSETFEPSTPLGKIERTLDVAMINLIRGLSPEQTQELAALMWLGRDGGDWGWLMEQGHSEVHSPGTNPAIYITDKADLDEYLDDGLELLGLKRRKAKEAAEEPA
jgi:hypothetical protein